MHRTEDKAEKSFNELHGTETIDGNHSFNAGKSDTESSDLSESTKNTSNNRATVPTLPPFKEEVITVQTEDVDSILMDGGTIDSSVEVEQLTNK